MRYRSLLIFVIVLALVLPGMNVLPEPLPDQTGPMVDKPSGTGPYSVGWTTDSVATTTKGYTVNVKIYYPATTSGSNGDPDTSSAPYPTVVWLPGYGGNENHYGSMLQTLSSWGIVVMAVGVDWNDFPYSANVTDMEDYLDYLESENLSAVSKLYTMVDKEAFGLSGHSSGGGLTVADAAYVDRIRAAMPFAAAINTGSVEQLAPNYDIPFFCQVGQEDTTYIAGCQKAFETIAAPVGLIEIIGVGHQGPYVDWITASFYLYWLDGQAGYYDYLYSEEAVQASVDGLYDIFFKLSDTHFFPPEVSANISTANVDMDIEVGLIGEISGYYPAGHLQGRFAWDFENDGTDDYTDPSEPNTTYTFDSPGNKEVVFKYRLGRLEVASDPPLDLTVNNVAPVADAGTDISADEDEGVAFDGAGSFDTVSDNATLQFHWDFDDGDERDFSTDQTATHAFTEAGVYNVELTVKDTHGLEAVDTVTVTVTNVAPTATTLGTVQTLEDDEVHFTGVGSDTVSDLGGLSYKWDFGDGNGTDWFSVPAATHIYLNEGNYTATLFVKDGDGDFTTAVANVTVMNIVPSGGITLPEGSTIVEEDTELEFFGWGEDTTSDLDSLEFMWDFGDGDTTGWGPSPVTLHTYTEAGDYFPTFSVRDDNGAILKRSVEVEVLNVVPTATILKPKAKITINEDEEVELLGEGSDTPTDSDALVTEWSIDGVEYQEEAVKHTFTKAGTYTVEFSVTDPDGDSSKATVDVVVKNVKPTLTAKVDTSKENRTIQFTATVHDTASDEGGLTVDWDLGDGTASSKANGVHTYSEDGDYTVTVTVTDDDGAAASQSFNVKISSGETPVPPPKKKDDGTPLSDMMLFGGIGAIIVVIIIILVALLLMRNKRKGTGETEAMGPPPVMVEGIYPEERPSTEPIEEEPVPPPGPPVKEDVVEEPGPEPEPEPEPTAEEPKMEEEVREPGPEPEPEPEPTPEEPKVEEEVREPETEPEPEPKPEPEETKVKEEKGDPDKNLDDILASIKGLQDK